ncbi:MAG: hypothetical protein MUC81_13755 [Bacteroidia bacterium]|jgi:hypothetical protein|nr:hypothetical protein [Bacteroidia bacterium]
MNDKLTSTNQISGTSITDIIQIIDVLKWPILVLIIVLLIKKPIVDLINRVTKIGHGGTSFEAEQQKSAEKQEKRQISNVDRALGLFRLETVEIFKSAVLQEINLDSIPTEKEKTELLMNYSIALYIIKHYELIYNSIYGSQLLILQQLNTFTYEDNESLKRYYDYAVERSPKFYDNYSYEEYIEFLYSFNLIVLENGRVIITVLGIDFLKYITETGKTLNKLN